MYAQIHNKKNWQGQHRQIVPLADDQIEAWLSEKLTETDIDRIIHDNLPEDGLTAHPVSKDIFSRTVSADYPGIEKLVDNPNLNLDYSQWA
jgi:putative SOS response-associated peptidase YedK